MSEQDVTKVCTTCHVLVSLDGFSRWAAGPDGLARKCKSCTKAYRDSPQGKAVRAAYNTSPQGRASKKAYQASPQGKARNDAYWASPQGRATKKAYNTSPKGKAGSAAYCASPHGKARIAAYVTSPQGKVALRMRSEKWRAGNPEKTAAHNSVSNAVRDGRLVRPSSCSACENTDRLNAHHDDYTKPLDVRWLCTPCHAAHHAAVRQAANLLFSKETHHDL